MVPVRVRDKSVADEKDRIASNLAKNDLSAKFKVFGKKSQESDFQSSADQKINQRDGRFFLISRQRRFQS